VVESELGLSHARKRGYLESKGELLVLVDDDNLLAADYLERAVEIASSKPFLGTFGGQCLPEYETQPAPNVRPFLGGLAIRELNCDSWSNLLSWNNSHPFGAGMCVRRGVLERLYQGKDALGRMLQLDRKGLDLASHGDHFINCYACKLGFGCGTFTALKLTHLMPSIRVTQKYLLRLYIGHAHSKIKLHSFFGMIPSDPLATFKDKIKFLFRWMTIRESTRRQFYWHETIASSKAIRAAKQEAEVHDEKQSSK
jgi:glycosyltransferase involved in cell wall biosynthesis